MATHYQLNATRPLMPPNRSIRKNIGGTCPPPTNFAAMKMTSNTAVAMPENKLGVTVAKNHPKRP